MDQHLQIVVEHTKQNEKVKDEEDEKEELGVLKDHNGSNSDEPKTDVKSSKAKTKKVKSSSANKENNKSGQKRSRKEQISDKAEKESKRPKISSKPASNASESTGITRNLFGTQSISSWGFWLSCSYPKTGCNWHKWS